MIIPIMLKTDLERFMEKVDIGECWLWTASKYHHGYGCFHFRGRMWQAHRVAWILYESEIPDGLYVLHRCNVKSCVRPSHLYLGSQDDNMKDAVRAGVMKGRRVPQGSEHGMSKLSDADVLEIRRRHPSTPATELAREFDVSWGMIYRILRRSSWKHI
jgi:hypothetical protein